MSNQGRILKNSGRWIVPEDVTPRYCHGLFPKEDRIIDFLNPWTDTELAEFVTKQAKWYPTDRLEKA